MAATVMIAHASKDEHGTYKNGKAGDQTKQEVCIRTWYNRPWTHLIRFNDPHTANKVAEAMERAAANDHIGYDQNQRNTLLTQARRLNYDPGRVTKDVETDCSALVSCACMYAGIDEAVLYKDGNSATTRTLRSRLVSTGKVTVYTDRQHVAQNGMLKRGDILLSEGHHVAVVVSSTSSNYLDPGTSGKKTINAVARDIVAGRLGNGAYRTAKLRAMGYSDSEIVLIQQTVNTLLGR